MQEKPRGTGANDGSVSDVAAAHILCCIDHPCDGGESGLNTAWQTARQTRPSTAVGSVGPPEPPMQAWNNTPPGFYLRPPAQLAHSMRRMGSARASTEAPFPTVESTTLRKVHLGPILFSIISLSCDLGLNGVALHKPEACHSKRNYKKRPTLSSWRS